MLGVAQRRGLGVDCSWSACAGVGLAQDVEALGVGGHHAVLDAVVHHLDEVPGAVRAAVQVAVLGGAGVGPCGPGCGGAASTPGASVRKIGSRRLTGFASPPIIRQ